MGAGGAAFMTQGKEFPLRQDQEPIVKSEGFVTRIYKYGTHMLDVFTPSYQIYSSISDLLPEPLQEIMSHAKRLRSDTTRGADGIQGFIDDKLLRLEGARTTEEQATLYLQKGKVVMVAYNGSRYIHVKVPSSRFPHGLTRIVQEYQMSGYGTIGISPRASHF